MSEQQTNSNSDNAGAAPAPAVAQKTSRPWLPVLIACIVAAIVLIILLIPGVLMYPSNATAVNDDDALLAMQRETNQTLEKRLAALQGLLGKKVCIADGQYMLPGADGKMSPVKPEEQGLLPVPPEDIQVPQPGAPDNENQSSSLLNVIDQATVLVLSIGKKDSGTGTGFFISPDTIITNAHVVSSAGNKLLVASKHLGKPKPAQLLARTSDSKGIGNDFAILKVAGANNATYLKLTENFARLDNVIAAGFPGLLLDTDDKFQRLVKGDAQSAPIPATTQGVVTAKQEPNGIAVVVHTAEISQGNSGGPLLDRCGRVVGVNTFYRKKQGNKANYALSTKALSQFLQSKGQQVNIDSEACRFKQNQVAQGSNNSAEPQ